MLAGRVARGRVDAILCGWVGVEEGRVGEGEEGQITECEDQAVNKELKHECERGRGETVRRDECHSRGKGWGVGEGGSRVRVLTHLP